MHGLTGRNNHTLSRRVPRHSTLLAFAQKFRRLNCRTERRNLFIANTTAQPLRAADKRCLALSYLRWPRFSTACGASGLRSLSGSLQHLCFIVIPKAVIVARCRELLCFRRFS